MVKRLIILWNWQIFAILIQSLYIVKAAQSMFSFISSFAPPSDFDRSLLYRLMYCKDLLSS